MNAPRRSLPALAALLCLLGCGSSDPEPPAIEPAVEPETSSEHPGEAAEPEAEEATAEADPPETERPYEEGVDAQAQIDAAVARAGREDKRVLLMFGANWCVWCRRLDWVFSNEPQVRAALEEGWVLVHVDVGARGSDTNRDVAARYGDPLQHGLPCLVVLDEAGEVAHVQETGSLEDGPRHDPERVLSFLSAHRPS